MKKILLVSAVVVLIDQFVKMFLVSSMNFGYSFSLMGNFFNITLLKNTGAAFSILSSNRWLLIVITIFSLILLYYFFINNKFILENEKIIYGLLFGGIFSNLCDRIFRGYVVDYFDFNFFGYAFPVFNIADICIVISIFLIIFKIYKGEKDGNKS